MAEMLVDGAKLDACLDAEADAIRAKTGGSTDIAFDYANNKGFADAIAAIETGGGVTTQPLSVTENGTYTAPSGTAYTPVTVNVPTGCSLPSVISKIDGGSFTLASDTAGNNHWISHNLGEMPKGIIIWTEDSDLRTSTAAVAQRYLLCSQLVLMDWVTGTTSNALIPNHLFRNTNGATSNTGSPITQAAVGNYIQTTRFNNALGAAYYKAGVEYKWVAYA